MTSTRPIRGFDETMPRAVQPTKRFDYRTRVSWSRALSFRRSELAPWIVRFNAIRFLLTGLFEAKGLCRQSTRALREEIERRIDEIQPRLCRKVMKNLDERVRTCPMRYSINNPVLYFTIRLKDKYLKTRNSVLYLIRILR